MGPITVFCDGVRHQLTLQELKEKNWNVVVNRTNGYSHDWQEVVPFDEKYVQTVQDVPTIWCTIRPVGFVQGSSVVSFS